MRIKKENLEDEMNFINRQQSLLKLIKFVLMNHSFAFFTL